MHSYHDNEEWLKNFHKACWQKQKELRRHIQQNTIKAIWYQGYEVKKTGWKCQSWNEKNGWHGWQWTQWKEKVSLPWWDLQVGVDRTRTFHDACVDRKNEWHVAGAREFGKTIVEVQEKDCLLAAWDLWAKDRKSHVAVLNMAARANPGGGWKHGCGAQEENLHRRTNLYQHLEKVRYPIPEYGGVFSPCVYVFRGDEASGYPFLEEPWSVSILSVAAYKYPQVQLDSDGTYKLTDWYRNATRRKIMSMLCKAKEEKVNRLVLSAFGCGAFHNPPGHMAEIFADCLAHPEVRGVFEHVVFAIIEDHNSRKNHSGGNVESFKKVFGDRLTTVDNVATVWRCDRHCKRPRTRSNSLALPVGVNTTYDHLQWNKPDAIMTALPAELEQAFMVKIDSLRTAKMYDESTACEKEKKTFEKKVGNLVLERKYEEVEQLCAKYLRTMLK